MKILIWLAGFCLLFLVTTQSAAEGLRVVTTTTDIAALVEILGGDRVEVESLCRGYQDPHYLEAKPSHMARLRRADLLAYVGLELEVGWLPLLVSGSRNPRLRNGEPGNLNMSAGIDILEIPTGALSRSEGDVHPQGNPHYWLRPGNLITMAQTLATRLAELDPAHAADYESARAGFQARMTSAIEGWQGRLAPWRGEQVVCYHKQWEYLLDWLDLSVLGYIENKPGIPPSPRHVSSLREAMRERGTRLVLISNFFEPEPARRVAESTAAGLLILPASVRGEEGLDDPFRFFDRLVEGLAAGFGGADG